MEKQIKIGSFLSFFQVALGILIGLLYTPLMIRLLGKSDYGIYSTVSSTISMLSILSLGFGSGYIRYYSIYRAKGDDGKIHKLNGIYLIVFGIIGIIVLTIGLYLSFHLKMVFAKGLSDSEYVLAKKLMILLTVKLALSFPATTFSIIISAYERFVFLKIIGMINTVVAPIITIPLLLLNQGAVAIVAVTLLLSLITDIIYIFYVFRILNEKIVFKSPDSKLLKNIFSFTFFIAINLIVDQINWNVDKIILGRFFGATTVAVYSAGALLQTYYNTFSTSISNLFTPKIHRIVNMPTECENKRQQLTTLFTKIGRIQFIILALICSGFVLFGKEFIAFWAGNGYGESYYVAVALIIPVTVPLIQNLGIEIQRAENKHRFRSIVYLGMAFANIVMTIFLSRIYGAVGAAIGTSISFIVANGFIMNVYYHKHCNIDIIYFWKQIIGMFKGLIIPVVLGVLLKHYFNFYGIVRLSGGILLYSLVYIISMFCFGMNVSEKNYIISIFAHIKKKVIRSKV